MHLLVKPGTAFRLAPHLDYIEKMVARGGPEPRHYASFDRWLTYVALELRTERMTREELHTLHEAFGRALSLETNQGMGLRKPHGYPGDYEIIDRIYREYITDDLDLQNWDLYFHTQAAPRAVRNRKAYFIDLLHALVDSTPGSDPLPVLNVASGPARDLFEFFQSNGHDPRVTVECIDADPSAIAYAETLCAPYLDRITFHEANALRFTSDVRYRLIWSAGLFDYFGDKGFAFLLERLLAMLDNEGELVIGNFSKKNTTRDYMEVIGEWDLYYRGEDDLCALAKACGVAEEDVRIGQEPEGVNLFLHIKRGRSFLPMQARPPMRKAG